MRSRRNDRRAARLMGWLSYAPAAVRNPMLLKTPEQWKEYGRRVTAAYAKAPLYDAKDAWRWKVLAKHIERMYKQMLSDIRVEFVSGQPYETAEEMSDNVKKSGVMYISTDFNEHPIFTPLQNLQFRAVHDYIVHIAKDKSFTLKGEIGSYNAHAKLVPPAAIPALYTEVVGQASTYFTTGEFPKQKIALLPFDPIRIGIEVLQEPAAAPMRAAANPRPARRNAGLSKREKMMVAAGVMEAPPEGYIKPGTFGPFVPMVGKFKYKVKMDGPQEYLDVALYEGTKRVGRLQLSPVGRRSGLTAQCLPLVEALGVPEGAYGHLRAWYVDWSEVNEDRRGQGLGRLLYDAALDAMYKATGGYRGSPGPFVFVPGDCSTISSTSALARRVWPSLARDYPHRSYDSQTIMGEKVSVYAIRVDHPPVFRLPKPSPARAAANPRPARRNAGDAYPWDASTKVQSIQFDKDLFTADAAKDWASSHGFKRGRVEVGQGNWLRIRQADPEHFRPSTFRVIPFREGVQAVIAVPKRGHR
jgi:GNAT superfamily N-acetyltransferase